MFKKLKELLQGVFNQSPIAQSDLERFISSKSPTSVAEIEHWTKIYDRRQGGRYGF